VLIQNANKAHADQ